MFINREKQYSEKENSKEYEKVVKQRELERKIRKQKTTRNALKAAGDSEGAKEYDRKIKDSTAHLEAFCDKNGLTVRRDRTEVYGYSDPNRKQKPKELVKVVKPNEEGSQYRKYEVDKENPVTITRGKEIQVYKVNNAANNIYISNDAHVKPKMMHQIDMKVSEAYDLIGMKDAENKPDIFIITGDEMEKTAVKLLITAALHLLKAPIDSEPR